MSVLLELTDDDDPERGDPARVSRPAWARVTGALTIAAVLATVIVIIVVALRRRPAATAPTPPGIAAAAPEPGQTEADAAEDVAIRRYREERALRQGLTVTCSRCGTFQMVHPAIGMRHFALVCLACHEKTLFSRPAPR